MTVIEGLREELRELDAIYSREALQHARERVELLRRITEHVTELHQAYRTSLRAVQVSVHIVWGLLVLPAHVYLLCDSILRS